MVKAWGLVAAAALLLQACSSLQSIEAPREGNADGLTYFMPNRDFLVTITIESGAVKKVVLGTTDAYPDTSTQYVLSYRRNALGKNTLDVVITESGLLTSTKSVTESKVSDAFKNLGTLFGQARAFQRNNAGAASCNDGDHVFAYKKPQTDTPCGVAIEISAIGAPAVVGRSNPGRGGRSGIFYRQNLPYLMTASKAGLHAAAIVFSPSESVTHFLPVSESLFTNNTADFGFKDGVPTKYSEDTDAEIVALLKLPADVIAAYFSAVGAMFESFKTRDTNQAEALAASLKLELAKQKYTACLAAMAAKDDARVKELGCGQ